MKKTFVIICFAMICTTLSGVAAFAANNEMTGFHYQTCDGKVCFVVIAPKAWISQSNGAFIATGENKVSKNAVSFRILDAGKVKHEFFGDEIASQPEVDSMTIDSATSVVLVDTQKITFEVITKPKFEARGAK